MAALASKEFAQKTCGEGCFVSRLENGGGGGVDFHKAASKFCAVSAPSSRSICHGKLGGPRVKPSISASPYPHYVCFTKALQPPQGWGIVKARALKEHITDEVFADIGSDDSNADDPFKNASFLLPEDLERRPRARGFGQGKSYDTSVEDALLADIETSTSGGKKKRQGGDAPVVAQSNGVNRKRARASPSPAVDHKGPFPWLLRGTPDDRYPPNTPTGVKVALGNLPKKKKVGRDLQRALVAVPGLLVIRPKEEGDRDTRDCTCKGSATLIFKDQQYALGFCTAFQGRPMQFGKIERRITAKLADQRQQPPPQAPEVEDEGADEEDEVDEMIEEGKKQGAEQLKRQNRLEEDKGRQALLEGVPQVDEAELQEATVKTPREDDHARDDTPAASPAPPSVEWAHRVDEEVRHGQEEGAAQMLEQRRKEETEGMDALLGQHHKGAKEGEDGRSAALSGSVEGRDARSGGGVSMAEAVRRGEAAGEDEVDIDDLFDEADLEDEALDDDGEEEEDDEGAWVGEEKSDEDEGAVTGIFDSAQSTDTAPRSSRVTKLLDDGTLIVKGQEVGRIDPALAQDGQLKVSKEVAERIASLTGGQPIEVELVTDDALQQKRAFEEKLRAWHFGQLPGFQGAEQPAKEEGGVTWDAANRTMVRGAKFDKAKHKRMKKEAREPQSLQEMARERQTEQSESDEGSEWEDDFEEEEWELDESDDDGDEGEAGARGQGTGPSARVGKGGVLGKVDYRELLAAEKRELAAGKARLKGRGETVPEPSLEVLELVSQMKSNPGLFDDEDDDEDDQATANLRGADSRGPPNGARSAQSLTKQRGKQEGESQRREGSEERHRSGGSRGKKSQAKRPGKPEYGKLISDLRQNM